MRLRAELDVWPVDPSRERERLFEVPLGVLDRARPDLGHAEVQQSERARVLSRSSRDEVKPSRKQSLGFLGGGGRVVSRSRELQASADEPYLDTSAAIIGDGRPTHARRA